MYCSAPPCPKYLSMGVERCSNQSNKYSNEVEGVRERTTYKNKSLSIKADLTSSSDGALPMIPFHPKSFSIDVSQGSNVL
jgi:hypothetical protein